MLEGVGVSAPPLRNLDAALDGPAEVADAAAGIEAAVTAAPRGLVADTPAPDDACCSCALITKSAAAFMACGDARAWACVKPSGDVNGRWRRPAAAVAGLGRVWRRSWTCAGRRGCCFTGTPCTPACTTYAAVGLSSAPAAAAPGGEEFGAAGTPIIDDDGRANSGHLGTAAAPPGGDMAACRPVELSVATGENGAVAAAGDVPVASRTAGPGWSCGSCSKGKQCAGGSGCGCGGNVKHCLNFASHNSTVWSINVTT